MRRPLRYLPLLLLLALSTACATRGPVPGTGDVSFRLHWEGETDLDLHVEDPDRKHIGTFVPHDIQTEGERRYIMKTSNRGLPLDHGAEGEDRGILDIDCNASPTQICPHPIENIYWPRGTAPRGIYRTRAILFQKQHSDATIPFILEIRQGERVVRTIEGEVSDAERASDWVSFEH